MSHIYLGGSRSLSPSSALWSQAQDLTQHIIYCTPHAVHVGCATGADQAVILALCGGSCQARVYAAFAESGAGSWSGSAVATVRQFAQSGGSVSWLAGGSLSVPLPARLMARSVAGLRGASAAVFFEPGVGSLKVAGHAVQSSIPVIAFSASMPASPRGCAGQWVASSFRGAPCWQWSPAQLSFI